MTKYLIVKLYQNPKKENLNSKRQRLLDSMALFLRAYNKQK
jgi:hypothetical protein